MIPSRRRPAIFAIWLALGFLIAVLYGRTTTYSFVWDDNQLIAQNARLTQAGLGDFFSDFWKNAEYGFESGYFRPLTTFTFFLDFKVYGESPGGYHLTNVVLYWLTCGLVFLFFLRFFDDFYPALVGTLLFTLHPVHVEPVAFVSSRTDLLATLLVLTAYLVGTRSFVKVSWIPPAGAAIIFFLAVMAKESSLPLLLFAPFFVPREKRKSLFWSLMAGTAAAILLRFTALSSVIPAAIPQKAPLVVRLFTIPAVMVYYLRVVFFPASLSALPAMEWVVSPLQIRFILPLLILTGTGGGLLALKKRFPVLWAGSWWGFVFLLPVLQIIQTTMRAAERFAFLPSVGFMLAVTTLFRGVLDSPTGKIRLGFRVLLTAVLIFFTISTAARVPVWENSAALWEATAKKEPENPTVINNLANVRFREGKYGEAEVLYRRALELVPDFPQALYNLALVLIRQNRHAEAIPLLEKVLIIDPEFAPATDLYNRATGAVRIIPRSP